MNYLHDGVNWLNGRLWAGERDDLMSAVELVPVPVTEEETEGEP